MLRITIAQINPTVGDLEGNVALMLRAARQARHDDARLVVFPELSLTAYHPGDLLDEPWFAQRLRVGFEALLQASREVPQLAWVVGAPVPNPGPGKRLHNALLVIRDGQVLKTYAKQLLPTYGVFDDRRHFEPGPDKACVYTLDGVHIGLMICEDGWNDDGQDYLANPFSRLAEASPDLVVSINASPSNIGKREQRHRVFRKACARHGLPLLYVNQVGGHDPLVFDGASFAMDATGQPVFEARRFAEHITTLAFDSREARFFSRAGETLPTVPAESLPVLEFYRQQVVLGLRDYARRCGFSKVVVGSSGGIDSALTLALAVQALGPEHVVAITMPSRFSSEGSVSDSVALCRNLGIALLEHPIGDIVRAFEEGFPLATGGRALQGLPLENLQARVRGTILMAYSNAFGHLLLSTGNKSETSVGYCTLYGDTNGGLNLIGDLLKTEVFALSRHLNDSSGHEVIPQAILDKAPSAELAPNQKDSDSLPPYEVLDEILRHDIEGLDRLPEGERERCAAEMARLLSTPEGLQTVQRVRRLIARSEYKRRQAPPIIRLRPRAFGAERRMPLAAVHGR